MSRLSTNIDMQRATFVESLHNSLRKQATQAIADQKKFVSLASAYIKDGLEESECIELLMIDGLSREASEGYISMVKSSVEETDDSLMDYTFQFEDESGAVLSSFDVGKIVRAASDDDAWTQAEDMLNDSVDENNKLLSVSRIK